VIAIGGAVLGVAGMAYGKLQLELKKQTVEQLHPTRVAWEQIHDPNRTSSHILPNGQNNPEDT
jgi:hypothetical protein